VTTVYAVNKGEYSDYRVVGLFSSMALAEKYMAAFPASGYDAYNDVKLFELDATLTEIDLGLIPFRVQMRRDGWVLGVKEANPEYMFDDAERWNINNFTIGKPVRLPKEEWWTSFYVWAKDKGHAIKIANERRIQKIALEGVTE
jgi:hypothetical protein